MCMNIVAAVKRRVVTTRKSKDRLVHGAVDADRLTGWLADG